MMTAVAGDEITAQPAGSEPIEQPETPQDVNPYRRVKVYELNHQDKWEDRGTGYVSIRTSEVTPFQPMKNV